MCMYMYIYIYTYVYIYTHEHQRAVITELRKQQVGPPPRLNDWPHAPLHTHSLSPTDAPLTLSLSDSRQTPPPTHTHTTDSSPPSIIHDISFKHTRTHIYARAPARRHHELRNPQVGP